MGKLSEQRLGASHTADWHATSQGLSHAKHIRDNVKLFESPCCSSPPHATLDFIQDEECSVHLAFGLESLKPSCRWDADSSITLHRFNKHTSHGIVHAFEVFNVVPFGKLNLRQEWAEWSFPQLVRRHRERAMGVSVISA